MRTWFVKSEQTAVNGAELAFDSRTEVNKRKQHRIKNGCLG